MFADLSERTRIARGFFVRVRTDGTVAREMLAGGFHPGAVHAQNEALGHRQRLLRIAVERALANRRTDVANIQYRGKTDIDILRDHFRRHQPARLLCQTPALMHFV
ncbi:hypothetical protein D3C81_1640270 [compost metagenome]